MRKITLVLALAGAIAVAPTTAAEPNPRVVLETSHGNITVELFPRRAPRSTANFLAYAREGFYDGTLFHRVIPGFMIQGGGFTTAMEMKPTRQPITNEADNGLANVRGTVAMARRQAPHSADAQFFINVADNDFLNHRDQSPRGWGYAVFGRVVDGMEVVDAIARVRTGVFQGMRDVPVQPVVIERARELTATAR